MDVEKVIKRVEELYYDGKFEEGLKLLEEIPDEEKPEFAYLLLGVGNKFLNRFYEAELFLNKILNSSDPKIRSYARWQIGAIEIYKGNMERGINLLKEIEPEMRKTPQYASFIFDLVEGLYLRNEIDECIEYLQKALKFSRERGDLNLIVTAISNLALAYDTKGDIKNALTMYLEAAKIAERQDILHIACSTLVNLAELYAELGDFESAFKTIERIKKKKCLSYEPKRGITLSGIAKVYLLSDRLKDARKTLTFLHDILLERDNSVEHVTYHILQTLLKFKEGALTDVENHIEYILENWEAKDSFEYRIAKFFKLYMEAYSGREINLSEIEEVVHGLCSDMIVISPLYVKVLLDFGNKEKALSVMDEISDCLRKRYGKTGYFTFFKDELKEVIRNLSRDIRSPELLLKTGTLLADREILENLFKRFEITEIIDELRKNPVFHPHLFLTLKSQLKKEPHREAYHKLVREYLSKNSISIITFGHLEVYIGPYKLTPKDWKRPVTRDLIKFFIVNKNKLIPREVIYEALWPGEDPQKTSSKFRVYISILRDVIEPWLLKDEKPRIIIYTEGKYLFSTENINIDVEDFEKLVADGLKSMDSAEAMYNLEKAVELYRGDFLEDDIYSDFIYIERERLRNIFFRAVNRLKELYDEKGNTGKARVLLDKAFFVDPTNDTVAYDYIELLLKIGERANARRILEIHKETLKKRYEIEPSEKILKLIGES